MCGLVLLSGSKEEKQRAKASLDRINHRGPDSQKLIHTADYWLGFTRLAIMDLSSSGDQPFKYENKYFLCNGEIYNHKKIKQKYSEFNYQSSSDCEVLIPLLLDKDISKAIGEVDGEFAFVVFDEKSKKIIAARDPMGIRPLFYGKSKKNGEICFASEAKSLMEFSTDIKPFPPGYYYKDGEFICYKDLAREYSYVTDELDEACKKINTLLVEGVKKRLDSDAPVGYLLSGGLDSSLVCSIAQKFSDKPIKTFAIGMSEDAIDLKYAKEVAEHIGSDHTEVIITKADVLASLSKVILSLESWDITTVRASVGMYLVCEYIKKHTEIKVLMTGEVSDEIFGYKYTDFAPSAAEFQKEAQKRVEELYIYDVLRADRCISAHSLEARVPFSDTDFVEYVMSIDPKIKMNSYGQGKYLLRKAFEEGDYLPKSILYREKAAFSDAVGHSLVECIKEYAQKLYSDLEYEKAIQKYKFKTPFTKESLMFRQIFEGHYPSMSKLIKDYWMPNKNWENCDVEDPSARVLPNYGESGA